MLIYSNAHLAFTLPFVLVLSFGMYLFLRAGCGHVLSVRAAGFFGCWQAFTVPTAVLEDLSGLILLFLLCEFAYRWACFELRWRNGN